MVSNIITNKKIKGIRLSLASPEDVLSWSSGEVTKPETINYKTFKYERGGLFDELIFGPSIDYKCPVCEKKYKKVSEGQICENSDACKKFKPEILSRLSRRRRMGHIDLASPVLHFWFFRIDHSIISKLLGLKVSKSKRTYSRTDLEDVVYFRSHIVLKSGNLKSLPKNLIININDAPVVYRRALMEIQESVTSLKVRELIREKIRRLEARAAQSLGHDYGVDFYEWNDIIEKYSSAKIGVGSTAIEQLVKELNIDDEIKKIETEISAISLSCKKSAKVSQSKIIERNKLYKRLKVLNDLKNSGQSPSNFFIRKLPVMPANLRPLVQLEGGRHTTTDINELYRRVIIRNNRLKKWLLLKAPVLIVQNEMRMLQEAVDALLDNKRRKPRPVMSKDNRALKSISDALTGKHGRFRMNLLGKRVDYSGRSVIVVGPQLRMHQVGIPRQMATRLFEPFIIHELTKAEVASSVKVAKTYVDELNPIIWPHVAKVMKQRVVLLNRAPTLHRLSIQAFEPVLIRDKAIRIHPLVTTAFNADFDGDQMAIHVPMSKRSMYEARELMMAHRNILGPKDGAPIVNHSQDMILGLYWVSIEKQGAKGEGHYFGNYDELIRAYELGVLDLHARVAVAVKGLGKKFIGRTHGEGYIISSVGKFIFNNSLPEHFHFLFGPKYLHYKQVPAKFFVPYGGNIYEQIKNTTLASPFTKQDVAEVVRKIYDEYSPKMTKKDFSKFIKVFNLKHSSDALTFVKKTCDTEKIFIPPVHAILIKNFLVKRFHEIQKRILLRNENVERLWEIEEKVEFLEKTWFDYTNVVAKVLDKMKNIGFKYSTMSGISMSVFDIISSEEKNHRVVDGEKYITKLNDAYDKGLVTDAERYALVIKKWTQVKESVEGEIKDIIKQNPTNPIFMMLNSGARSNLSNIVQLAGMRGLMADASVVLKANDKHNKLTKIIIEVPVKSSFVGGLTGFEFYSSTHGARKALTDVALNTSSSGYLTRKLVNACQDIIVKENDCQSDVAFPVTDIIDTKTNTIISSMQRRIVGRFPIYDVVDDRGNVIVPKTNLITQADSKKIVGAGIKKVFIRSVLSCNVVKGVCKRCYGVDLASNQLVNIGEFVGILASQSVGEPGTQLTMRTFHTGGIAQEGGGITGGFQRLKELIDATQTPWSTPAIISEIAGVVTDIKHVFPTSPHRRASQATKITVVTIERKRDKKVIDKRTYTFASSRELRVRKGDEISVGQKIVDGPIVLKQLKKLTDVRTVQQYILKEIQRLYLMQGIVISDKYVEIIIRQMFSKIVIVSPGDTKMFAGSVVDINTYVAENKLALDNRQLPAYGNVVITGIRKVATFSDSFLDAASYQETPFVLVHASLAGQIDPLNGPKENVILGNKIPAGTGFSYEKNGKYDIVIPREYFE